MGLSSLEMFLVSIEAHLVSQEIEFSVAYVTCKKLYKCNDCSSAVEIDKIVQHKIHVCIDALIVQSIHIEQK